MTELQEPPVYRDMTDEEKALADDVYSSVQAFTKQTERSRQAQDFVLGISDVGFCSERVRRTLDGQVPDDTDMLAAFLGSAIGDYIEQAYKATHPRAIIQATVEIRLVGETMTYVLPGHPDIVDPRGLLIDGKTDRGLGIVRREGPNRQQQFQRHMYGVAAFNAGLFDDDVSIEDVKVANVWFDRAADEKECHVHMEPLDLRVVEEAAWWVDEVVYAWKHNMEARKEPPREVCAVACGFYKRCRAFDTDVEGRLTDDRVLTAVGMYVEGRDLEKQGAQLKDQAKAALDGISGSTGEFSVRWVWINPTEVPPHTKRGYNRLDVRSTK